MNVRLTALFVALAAVFASCTGARKRVTRVQRVPTALPRLNIKYLGGSFVVGPSSKTEPMCQITYLNPVKPDIIEQTASAVELDGTSNFARPGQFNTFKQIGGTGEFRLQGAPFVLKIIKAGPVVNGSYLFIVLFDGTNYTTEISNVFLFNIHYKWSLSN